MGSEIMALIKMVCGNVAGKMTIQRWLVLSLLVVSLLSLPARAQEDAEIEGLAGVGTVPAEDSHSFLEVTTTAATTTTASTTTVDVKNTTTLNTTSLESSSPKGNTGAIVAAAIIAVAVCFAVVLGVYLFKRRRQFRMQDKEKKMQIQMSSARNAGVYHDLTVSVPADDKPSASPEHEHLKATEEA